MSQRCRGVPPGSPVGHPQATGGFAKQLPRDPLSPALLRAYLDAHNKTTVSRMRVPIPDNLAAEVLFRQERGQDFHALHQTLCLRRFCHDG
jgi:hypothetical protein